MENLPGDEVQVSEGLGGAAVKLSEALEQAKKHVEAEQGCQCYCVENLIEAVEAYLEAERRHADTIVGLADLQRWDGGQ